MMISLGCGNIEKSLIKIAHRLSYWDDYWLLPLSQSKGDDIVDFVSHTDFLPQLLEHMAAMSHRWLITELVKKIFKK